MGKPAAKPDKKLFGLTLNRELMKEIQRLALDLDRFTNDVVEEAMQDILKKYREKKKPER